MKKIKDVGINIINKIKKHKIITMLVFIVLLIGGITLYITFGYWSGGDYYKTIYNGKVEDLEIHNYQLRYFVYDSDVGDYVFTARAPINAYRNNRIQINTAKSSCTGCSSSPFTSLNIAEYDGEEYILPAFTASTGSADLYFDLNGSVGTPDIVINMFKRPKDAKCGGINSCAYIETHNSLETLFNDGYAINYTTSSCNNGATFSVDYKGRAINVSSAVSTTNQVTCNIYFDNGIGTNLAATIKNKYTINTYPTTSMESNTYATTNEGLIALEDEYGTSYILRGYINDNQVNFAGYRWRIIRIDGDGSLRMIMWGINAGNSYTDIGGQRDNKYNAGTGEYATEYQARLYESTHDHMRIHTSTVSNYMSLLYDFYEDKLLQYDNYISDNTLFCNDMEPYSCNDRIPSGTGACNLNSGNTDYEAPGSGTFYFGQRVTTSTFNGVSDLKCYRSIDIFSKSISKTKLNNNFFSGVLTSDFNQWYTLTYPIGGITLKEWILAGNIKGTNTTNNYLTSTVAYWTISPATGNPMSQGGYGGNTMNVISSSNTATTLPLYSAALIRPVISLAPGVRITGGSGTNASPYTIDVTK